ncbi:MAG: hypothetical protein AB7O52_18845 [Planctomycetota bacterium]
MTRTSTIAAAAPKQSARARRAVLVLVAAAAVCATLAAPAQAKESVTEKGPVRAVVRVTPEEPRIGDDLTLVIEVTAEPGVELILPAYGEAIDRFEVVGYFDRERLDDQGRTVMTQEYTLLTSMSGRQSIPEILIEFVDRRPGNKPHPDGEDAYELLTERLDFEIATVLPQDAAPELRPAIGPLAKRLPPAPRRWPWLLAGLVVVIALSPLAIKAYLRAQQRARRRSAFDIARARLELLLARPRASTEFGLDSFYVELSGIVRRYLEDRFELRAPELTTEEFLDTVGGSPDLSVEHQRLLHEFLRGADLVKFAHHRPTDEAIDGSVATVRRFLEETRENAPLIEVNDVSDSVGDATPVAPRQGARHA